MSKNVRRFMVHQISKGRSEDEIKVALVNAGHDQRLVERNFFLVKLRQIAAFCVIAILLAALMAGIVIENKATGNMVLSHRLNPDFSTNMFFVLSAIALVVTTLLFVRFMKKAEYEIEHDLILRNNVIEWIREGRNGLEIKDNLMSLGLPEDNVHRIIDEVTSQFYSSK